MPNVFLPFDGWQPALSIFGEGWGSVNNVYQPFSDWRPWRQFTPSANSIAAGAMVGAHVHIWASGIATGSLYMPDNQTLFTGSANGGNGHLYTIAPDTGIFTDVSKAALYAANSFGWRFASVGNDIWAANGIDILQRLTNNAGLFADGPVSTFKPQARFLKTVREHLVPANLSNAGHYQDEVVWSDANDPTNFDPAATGSTSVSIAGGKRLVSIPGQITGLVGGQYLLAFKRNSIFYGEYAGPPQTFNFDVLSTCVGTAWPSSIINTRYGVFFLGADGFYKIVGLSEPQKVSTPGIDQFLIDSGFTQNLYFANPRNEDTSAIGFQAPNWPMIGWALRSQYGSSGPGNNDALLFNPVNETWSPVDIGAGSARVTAVIDRPYSTVDIYDTFAAITYNGTNSVFSPMSSGIGNVAGATLGLNFRPANFDGTWKFGQSSINWILPIFTSAFGIGGTPLTASITVDALLDPQGPIWKTETRQASERDPISGAYPFQIAGRIFRITVNCTPGEEFASFDGIYVDSDLLSGAKQQ